MTAPSVFVVDDDEAVRDSLCEIFESEGLTVRPFASAEDFLAAGADQGEGCLVVDIHMPGLTGLELQAELGWRGCRLPVIVITGQGDVPKAVAALKAGAVDFVEKPFDIDVLLAAVAEALDRSGRLSGAADEEADIQERRRALSPREREVMDLVVAGHPNKVVAARLGISARTVENHRAKVMEKMACASLPSLIHAALKVSGA